MKALTLAAKTLRRNWILKLYKHYIIDSVLILRQHGMKELIKRRGWKFLALIFAYYLVRDTLIYIVLPLCVAKGFF